MQDFRPEWTQPIIGAAIEVHRELGPGLLESTYRECLRHELELRGHAVRKEVHVPIIYKGLEIDAKYRLDLLVDERVIVELKAVSSIEPIHEAQLLTYMRLMNIEVGLLINFNVTWLQAGIRRRVLTATPPS